MKKFISILASTLVLAGFAHAQNQVVCQASNITVTVKAADSNSTAVVVGAQDMSKIWAIRIVNTGTNAITYGFGAVASLTNAYATALSNGIPLAASGSITYNGAHGLPSFPLSAKTTVNTDKSTLVIEILKIRP